METKVCSKCGKEYPATNEHFYKRKDGLRKECKNCRKEMARKRYVPRPKPSTRVEKTCIVCGGKFTVKAHRANIAKYCSQECYGEKRGLPGEKNPMWKGGVIYDPFGYKLVRVSKEYPGVHSNGYIRNCRYVWQETTGEVLKPEEVIHHINCDKTDDTFENLQKFANQAEHIRIGHNGRPERGG